MSTDLPPLPAAYADARETLIDEGYTDQPLNTMAAVREALYQMQIDGALKMNLALDWASTLDEADDEAELDAEEAAQGKA